jgi:hypothetical protein
MIKRFLLLFAGVLLYLALWALPLYGLILLWEDQVGLLLAGIGAITVLLLLGFVPFLDAAAKRVFSFRGEGAPLPADALRAQLLAVNDWVDAPVQVALRTQRTQRARRRGGPGTLVVTWRYVDARWWELLAKAGLTELYELHVRLDETRRRATLIDVTKAVQWRAGPTEVRVRGGWFRGLIFAFEIGQAWGIRGPLGWDRQPGQVYAYRFVPTEIKLPVLNTLLRSGWDVRFGLW